MEGLSPPLSRAGSSTLPVSGPSASATSVVIGSSPRFPTCGKSLKTAPAVADMMTRRRSAHWTLLPPTAISLVPGLSLFAACWVPASSVGHMPVPDTARTGPNDALLRGLTDDLRLAHLLADDADSITMSRFRSLDLRVTSKPDLTPVSDADTATEQGIRRTLSRARPRDAVHGEEMADTGWGPLPGGVVAMHAPGWGRRRWVIEPIDGTKNFVRGVPVWGTLIALMIYDKPAVGVVSAPALGRRWGGGLGGRAFAGKSLMSATQIHVSDVATIEDASLSYASISAWVESGQGQQFVDLLRACWRTRAYGDFWSYMLLAEGGGDLACEPELALHDMAACAIIVTEAGGAFTDLDGRPGPLGAGGYASNGRLHDAFLEQLR